jgi:hypothetical protein
MGKKLEKMLANIDKELDALEKDASAEKETSAPEEAVKEEESVKKD